MLKELPEYGNGIKKTQEEMKATLSEIKKNIQEPTVEGRKPGFKSMIWNRKKKKQFNQNSKKKKQSKKQGY